MMHHHTEFGYKNWVAQGASSEQKLDAWNSDSNKKNF